jgi:hypothetical protein
MSEIPNEKVLQEVIDYLREKVNRYEPSHPISEAIGRMFVYACAMYINITGESEDA